MRTAKVQCEREPKLELVEVNELSSLSLNCVYVLRRGSAALTVVDFDILSFPEYYYVSVKMESFKLFHPGNRHQKICRARENDMDEI